jgi:thiol-disulfide isomerase/thioredoxin
MAGRLALGVSARIVYHDPPPSPTSLSKPMQARLAAEAARRQAIDKLVARRAAKAAGKEVPQSTPTSTPAWPQPLPVLHLRSGDTISCTVSHIDEKGITFETALTDATFIPHDQVKALELMPEVAPAKIARPKKERLLTLPRMLRDNPPTQLIRSVDGDYLRGRLVEMDDKQLQVEIRLETKTLPRDSVARIIWLHADEIESASPPAASTDKLANTRVQAIPSEGNRLTFFAEQLEGSTLSGRSELLGSCRVDLEKLDHLLVGAAIEQAAATLAFHQWKLKPAADPLATKDDGSGSDEGGEGLESALVGKPAPDFELELLDGKKFHLADRKDKILVLDFWASWCGPCLQVMPQVEKVAREFADHDVELLAINLEETPDQVKAALERLQLEIAVALDREGRVAEKYGATSIPQTVIIGRDGKVARLFVGGSARFSDRAE